MATVLVAVGLACSSPSEQAPVSEGATGDLVVMEASDQTRSELGVETWGLDSGQSEVTTVRGYDGSHTPIVQFAHKTSAKQGTFEATLSTKESHARMTIEAGAGGARFNVLENTFANDARARKIVDRIIADLETQSARAGGKLTGRSSRELQASGLRPQTKLVEPVGCLTTGCNSALTASASAGANAVSACQTSTGATSNCSSQVSKASQAQEQTQGQCSSCDSSTCDKQVDIEGPPVRSQAQTFANEACCFVEACRAGTYNGHQPSADLALDMLTSEAYGQVPSDNHEFGNRLAEFAVSNMSKYRIAYVIYRQRIHQGDGWSQMEDRGSITQNHFDHVHVSFEP
ncbi:hypothetical protein [Pendulispora albinea]|uniref:ARB-07466-like C-terminal domain-containing protein n=1 Tax=Pendulispora albinea TaxID=2741071 RepID=A0ABZ2LSK1_9BACT